MVPAFGPAEAKALVPTFARSANGVSFLCLELRLGHE